MEEKPQRQGAPALYETLTDGEFRQFAEDIATLKQTRAWPAIDSLLSRYARYIGEVGLRDTAKKRAYWVGFLDALLRLREDLETAGEEWAVIQKEATIEAAAGEMAPAKVLRDIRAGFGGSATIAGFEALSDFEEGE